MGYGILVPQSGITPVPPAVEAQSPNHWTAREITDATFFGGWRRAWESTPSILTWRIPWTEERRGQTTVLRVSESWTWLRQLNAHTYTHTHAHTHRCVCASRLQSIGSQRVKHDWSDFIHTHTHIDTHTQTHTVHRVTKSWTWLKWLHTQSSVHSLSRVLLFPTPWTTAHQASLSTTNS